MSEYTSRVQTCVKGLQKAEWQYDHYMKEYAAANEHLSTSRAELEALDGCTRIVQSIAGELQNSVRDKIVAIVQAAVDETFPDLTFNIEFVTRRDKTECDIYIKDQQGSKQNILDGCGGGVKDIISFALRVALWSLDQLSSPVIILDEPFKYVSEGMRYQGANLLQVISKKLGIQFIVVSHVQEIIDCADTTYSVQKNSNGVSVTKIIKN